MLVKFNARGKGGSAGAVDYLLGKNRDRHLAKVIKGDVSQTAQLIDSLNFARNYTSGCLSFEESDIAEQQKQQLMDSFESAIFSGLEADQYDITWIEHRDKGRLELNFLIPNVELQTGKRLQPYYHKADKTRINAWQTAINGTLGFSDPHDPANARALCHAADLPKDRQKAQKAITNGLMRLAQAGEISSREDVIRQLSGHGFTVTRETKTSISVTVEGSKKPLRLKGKLYERDFKFGTEVRAELDESIQDYRNQRKQRVQEARRTYQEASRTKQEENRQRYPRPHQAQPKPARKRPIQDNGSVHNRSNDRRIDSDRYSSPSHRDAMDKINNWVKENERNHETTSSITATITATIRQALQRLADAVRPNSRTNHSDYRQYKRTRQHQQQHENRREWGNTMRPM